jgi:nucleoside-diphosphate kinase
MEMTFAIIKPDAVRARVSGRIIQRIEDEGFQIRAMRLVNLSKREAEGFYAVHRARPFFSSLTAFMSSGPAIVLALEAPDAIRKWRTLMGATDPAKADPGTLRKEFGASIENNATHGSDAPETAAFELGYFFPGIELAGEVVGKQLLIGGLVIAGVGLLMMAGLPLGRLPGDIIIRKGSGTFYFPLVTCILLSIILTLLLAVLRR